MDAVAEVLVEKSSGIRFGKLRLRTNQILTALKKDLDLQIFADYSVEPQNSLATEQKRKLSRVKSRKHSPLSLHANLYGPVGLFEWVGLFASRCHVFLQHPRCCDRNVSYRNPHCLSSDIPDVLTLELHKLMDLPSTGEVDTTYNPIDSLIDSIEHTDLLEAPQPIAIRTPLYKHQRQALDFMLRREHGWALRSSHRDVWKLEVNEFGKEYFLNTVTGQKRSRRPEEFRGGLLTDAPGLGKTLCVLALVAHSRQTIDNTIDKGISATLLVVPKSRRSIFLRILCKILRSSSHINMGRGARAVPPSKFSTVRAHKYRHSNPDFKLRHCRYYGKDRTDLLKHLDDYDLVITTYSVSRMDWKASLDPENASPSLYKVRWGRIVLDEGLLILAVGIILLIETSTHHSRALQIVCQIHVRLADRQALGRHWYTNPK